LNHSSLTILMLSLTLAACADLPMSTENLRLQQTSAKTICSELPVQKSVQILTRAWSRCYGANGAKDITIMAGGVPTTLPIANSGVMLVDVETHSDMSTVAVRLPKGQVTLMADLKPTESCPSEISARGVQGLWISSANNIESWMKNPDSYNPFLTCN